MEFPILKDPYILLELYAMKSEKKKIINKIKKKIKNLHYAVELYKFTTTADDPVFIVLLFL